jgi:hypothetical protein
MITSLLAQSSWPPEGSDSRSFIVFLVGFGVPAVLLVGALVYRDWRRNLRIKEQNVKAIHARHEQERAQHDAQREQRDREERAYKQHVALNDLTGRKLEAESKLLESQVERDRTTREREEEFHKLMVQKTRLEIQSLQLHIREQRKRIDDFTSYDEE